MNSERQIRKAFTLIEMLVVVTLIVLVISASGGVYLGTYKRLLVKKSAMDFMRAAKYARTLAVERKTTCYLNLDIENCTISLSMEKYDESIGDTVAVPVRDAYFKPIKFAGDVKFEGVQIKSENMEDFSAEDEQREITFSSSGSSQSAVIQIGDTRNHYTVSISAATGKSRLYDAAAVNLQSDTIDLDEE